MGLVIIRFVKPEPGALVVVATTLAATSNTLDEVTLSEPLVLVALVPVAAVTV